MLNKIRKLFLKKQIDRLSYNILSMSTEFGYGDTIPTPHDLGELKWCRQRLKELERRMKWT